MTTVLLLTYRLISNWIILTNYMNADIKLDVVIFSQRNELKLGCLAKFVFKQPPQARYFMHSSITFETVSTVSLLLLIISNSYPIILIYQSLLA